MNGTSEGRAVAELREELRTHRRYAGWYRMLEVLADGDGISIGRLADRIGKPYHNTYVQLRRLREFVTAFSRRNAARLGERVSIELLRDRDPALAVLRVQPVVCDEETLALPPAARRRLERSLAELRRTLGAVAGVRQVLRAAEVRKALAELEAAAQVLRDLLGGAPPRS